MLFSRDVDPRGGWWWNDPYLGPSVDVDGARECCLGVDDNVIHMYTPVGMVPAASTANNCGMDWSDVWVQCTPLPRV
jgi:hypothetical protein